MEKINSERFDEIFQKIQDISIAVVGDLMVDRYVWGKVERISPEAPVPIISLEGESSNLGGGANVAANVGSLAAEVRLFGLTGNDSESHLLRDLVKRHGYSDYGIVIDPDRKTSVKTRVIAQSQHLVRIDRETVLYINETIADELLKRFKTDLNRIDAVIIQDYNKGVLSPKVIHRIIDSCRTNGIPVGVDPKLENFWEYTGATLFKPNMRELEAVLGRPLHSDMDFEEAGKEVLDRLQVKYLLVTSGSKGMTLFSAGEIYHVPTKAHRVHDVSGAGDTVIATIMTALAGGASIKEAATLATYAASVVIAEVGAVPIDPDDLRRACVGRNG